MLYKCLSDISTRFQPLEPSSTVFSLFKCIHLVRDYSSSSPSLNDLPIGNECILILIVTYFVLIVYDSLVFRPLEAYARSVEAHTTIGKALMNRTLPHWSLSLVTFKKHHIHSTTTLHALTTTLNMCLLL
jgi:hypothetical protein